MFDDANLTLISDVDKYKDIWFSWKIPNFSMYNPLLSTNWDIKGRWNKDKDATLYTTYFFLEIITCEPSKHTMDHSKILYQTRRKNPLLNKGFPYYMYALCFLLFFSFLELSLLVVCAEETKTTTSISGMSPSITSLDFYN